MIDFETRRGIPRPAAGTPCFLETLALAILLALGAGTSAGAGEGRWTLQLEPMLMDAYGHDQHVLTVREVDLGAATEQESAVTLDTNANPAYRLELQRTTGPWGLGVDFFWFNTSQGIAPRSATAGGSVNEVVFEVADRRYTSSGPGEALFFRNLEDTALAVWSADLYAIRTLAEKPESALHLHFGLRFGDFDNDYRGVVGIGGVGGSRVDASSNYSLMMGPLVGLAADARRGKHSIKAYLGQSMILGKPELTSMYREFTGDFIDGETETSAYFAEATFRSEHDVAIPITDFRFKWTYGISDRLSLGIGANTSIWWDVSVPPGVIPIAGGDAVLHENTIVFFGMLAAVELSF